MTIPIIPVTLTEYKRLSLTEALSGKYVIDSTFESHNRTLKTVNAIWKNLDVPEAQLIRYKLTRLIKTQDLVNTVSKIFPAKTISIDNIGETNYVIAWFDTTQDKELDYLSCNEVFFGFSNENIFDYLPPIEDNDFTQVTEDVPGYKLVASTVSVGKDDYESFIRDKVFVVQEVTLEEMTGDDNLYHLGWEYDDNGDVISVPDKIHIPADIRPLETIEGVHNWSNIRIAKANLDVYGGIDGHIYVWTRSQEITKVKS